MSKNPLFFSSAKNHATTKHATSKCSSVLDQLFSKVIKHERAIEETLGDNNCAFNAFVLGLCDVDVLNGIEAHMRSLNELPDLKLKKFRLKAAAALGVPPTWADVRRQMLKPGYEARYQLQIKLAPVMRDLAIDLTAADPADIDEKWATLAGIARGYFAGDRSDDIFLAHSYIREVLDSLLDRLSQLDEQGKFDESESDESDVSVETSKPSDAQKIALSERQKRQERIDRAIDESIEILRDWWYNRNSNKSSGYEYFLTCMRQQAIQNRKWAGDMELGLLANYFHVRVFNRQSNGIDQSFAREVIGSFPLSYRPGVTINDFNLADLVGRCIVEGASKKNGRVNLALDDAAVIQRRLQAVPELDQVLAFINSNKNDLYNRTFVSDEPFSEECLKELSVRGVVSKQKLVYFNKLNYKATLACVRCSLGEPADKPELDRVLAFMKLNAKNLPNAPLNVTQLSKKGLDTLLKSGLISTKERLNFNLKSHKEALARVNAFPDANKLFLAIKAIIGIKKPHIILKQERGHWENTRMFTEATDWMTYHLKGIGNNKWEQLLKNAVSRSNKIIKEAREENEGELPSMDKLGLVNYYLAGDKPIRVLKADQEKLDESVAKRMQEQEIRVYRSGR